MRFKSKLVLVLVFIIMSFSAFAAKSNKKEDVKMSNIVLYDQYGKKHNIEEYKGKVVVIAVFPSVDTGVCALQLARFNQEAASFGDDVQLLTISVDLPFALGRYCADKGIANALTASDHKDLDFGTKYGFVIKELRLLARGVVIVDKNGIIQYVEYVPEIGEQPDYERALKVIKELTK